MKRAAVPAAISVVLGVLAALAVIIFEGLGSITLLATAGILVLAALTSFLVVAWGTAKDLEREGEEILDSHRRGEDPDEDRHSSP